LDGNDFGDASFIEPERVAPQLQQAQPAAQQGEQQNPRPFGQAGLARGIRRTKMR